MGEEQGFISKVTGVLTRPTETFKNIDEASLSRGFIIVLVAALLSGLAQCVYLSKIPVAFFLSRIPVNIANPGAVKNQILTFAPIFSAAELLIFWLFTTLIIHVASSQLSQGGSLNAIYAKTGYASTVLIIQQLVRLIDASILTSGAVTGLYSQGIGQQGLTNLLTIILRVYPLFRVLYLILVGMAIAVNYSMSPRRATIIALASNLIFLIIPLLM